MTRVIEALPTIRQLDFQKEVSPQVMTRQALVDYLEREFDTEARKNLIALQEVYLILRLMEPGTDLVELYLDLLGEQVLGLFNTEDEELYVVSGAEEPGPLEEITLAHEYTHALQQQHFNIYQMGQRIKKNRDQAAALSALVEGDATLAGLQYLIEQLSTSDLLEALSQDVSTSVLDSTPNIVRRSLVFPYIEGLSFIQNLFGSGSWETVNDAFFRSSNLHRAGPPSTPLPWGSRATRRDPSHLSGATGLRLGDFGRKYPGRVLSTGISG